LVAAVTIGPQGYGLLLVCTGTPVISTAERQILDGARLLGLKMSHV
jgi:hypothetical protein